jgi:hypothetical protein
MELGGGKCLCSVTNLRAFTTSFHNIVGSSLLPGAAGVGGVGIFDDLPSWKTSPIGDGPTQNPQSTPRAVGNGSSACLLVAASSGGFGYFRTGTVGPPPPAHGPDAQQNRPRLVAGGGSGAWTSPWSHGVAADNTKRPCPKTTTGPKFASELAIPPHRSCSSKPTIRCRSCKGCGWTSCEHTIRNALCTKRVRSGLLLVRCPPESERAVVPVGTDLGRQPVPVDANLNVRALARWVDAVAAEFAHLPKMSEATERG